ncbi:MAG: hypothetical protein DRQ47_04975 [Gammaproteobacteria bacterium]|nr:MAG: hypothetical protein DRQ47_04975 [Gammaproteobacteria bacterium]
MSKFSKQLSILCLVAIFTPGLTAEQTSFESAWDYAKLYQNTDGDYLNLSGRIHLDSAWFDSSQGEYNDISWRRFRFGFKGKYGRTSAALEADIDLNEDLGDSYNRLTDANLSWKFDGDMKVTALKHSAGFTLDGKTSSKKLFTPQRNNLTNNLWFTSEYFTGVSIKGNLVSASDWSYNAGLFSSDDSDEIGFTDASYFTLFSLGRKLDANALWNEAEFRVDYVYNDVHEDGNTRDFTHVVSLSSKFASGKWHLWNDLAMGQGDLGQSDLWGLVIMPFYQQTENFQWVMRYTYLDSDDHNGLRLGRYENKIVDGKGDRYHEVYGGANYFFNSHKLKLHLGLQYTDMADGADDVGQYDGWGLTLALRAYW